MSRLSEVHRVRQVGEAGEDGPRESERMPGRGKDFPGAGRKVVGELSILGPA